MPKPKFIEFRGFAFIDGKVVVVGKATQEKDHGDPIWLCSTMPPKKQMFQAVKFKGDVANWLKKECGAEEVFEGSVWTSES